MKKSIVDYGKFFTKLSKKKKPNLIRVLTAEYAKNPQALFFAGGIPNAEMFPFKEISVTYIDGTKKKLENVELSAALQYGPTQGYLALLSKWRELQEKWHSPKYSDWDVQFTTGSMEGCSKIFEMMIEEGDSIMVQTPIYTGILSSILPMGPDYIPIGMDDEGAILDDIVRACEKRLKSGKPLPKLLYTNPTGGNPVGTTYSSKRKEEIYKLAQHYNFLLLEDDAYYFLYFTDERPRSFLSMDVDGRVLRLDSFSKIMSAGLRLGVVTAPKPILDKLNLHVASSTLHASSLSQVLVYHLLQSWSAEQLEDHFVSLRKFYRDRRDLMLKAVNKYFTGIAEWSVPGGGMFIWLKVTVMEDVYDLAMNKCVPQGVFVLPGHAFYPDSARPCPYLRICYSQATPEEIEEGFAKIAEIIRKEVGRSQQKERSRQSLRDQEIKN